MRKYSSLKIAGLVLVMIWAVVLLEPAFNYYYRLQVADGSGADTAPMNILLMTSKRNFWENAAQRFPSERDVLYQASQESPGGGMGRFGYDGNWVESKLPSSLVFPGRPAADGRMERVRRTEILRRKFPGDAFLIAAEIRARQDSFQPERIGGELSDPTPSQKWPPGYVSPERWKEKTNFTLADFQNVIALCRLGQKLEPENGYFDWMESFFLFHSWRDAQALKALEAVGRKQQYDDHTRDEIRAEINALSLVRGRPLLFEEKISPLTSVDFIHYPQYRELARIISWQAIKAQRRGDHEQAIHIAKIFARACVRMRDNSRGYIDTLTAIALEAQGWGSLIYGQRISLPKGAGGYEQIKRRHQAVLAYLNEQGQQALAAEVAKSYAINTEYRLQSREYANSKLFGLSFRSLFFSSILWTGGVLLLLLLVLPLFVLLLMRLGKRIGAVRRWLRWDESGLDEVPSAREVRHGMLACAGLRACALGLCAFLVINPVLIIFDEGPAAFLQHIQQLPFLNILFQVETVGGYDNPWMQLYFSLGGVLYTDSPWRIAILCIPILFGSLYIVWRAVEWQKRRNGEVSAWLSIGRVVDFVIILLLIWGFCALALAEFTPEDFGARLIVALMTLACVGILLFEKIIAWRKRPQRRAAVRYSLRLLQRSLFSWLVVGSAVYLLTLVATTFVRHQVDRDIDRVVAVGEVRAAQERGE